MELREREPHLRELHRALADAATGHGRTVLVTGEAGIGKTSLVERFANEAEKNTRVLWGVCEALFTPRPLGAFHDIVHALGGPLLAQLKRSTKPVDLFHELLDAIRSHDRPSAIVIEDAHWADHGTLDFIKFLARRIPKLPAVLVLTYRDDEIGADHPLATMLGDVPADSRVRLRLPSLSREAVEQLGREAGRALPDLYHITGGNPFFVTELLRDGAEAMASSVREAVLSRARGLSEPARALLDVVSVVPDRVELHVLEGACGGKLEALEECVARGLLRLDADQVSFRHELARMAVEAALPPIKRMRLNRSVLDALAKTAIDSHTLTRLAHHAIGAKDAQAILTYAPQAANAASERGAHRETVALLTATLPHVERLPTRERAEFHERRVGPHVTVGQCADAIAASETAYRLWHELGDEVAKGHNLVHRLRFPWAVEGGGSRIDRLRGIAREATVLLERFPPGGELALAYAALATFAPIDDPVAAEAYRSRATELAQEHCDAGDLADVLFRIALSEWSFLGAPRKETLERLMHQARAAKHDLHLITACQFEAERAFAVRDLRTAEQTIREGQRVAEDRQLDDFWSTHNLKINQAMVAAARGEWAAAEAHYDAVLRRPTLPGFIATLRRLQMAIVVARQGRTIDHAWVADALGRESDYIPKDLYILHQSNAEIAWLTGNTDSARRSGQIAWRLVKQWEHPWLKGEVALLRLMMGDPVDNSGGFAGPYALQFAGDWRGAAETWRRLGYPYEEALALTFGDEEAQREALHILNSLGAKAVAERVRDRMREQGVRGIPRGPIASTRSNPCGLTEREFEVLALLAEGLSNAAIARRLHRSVKTVDHHVSAVMGKLGAGSRIEAVAIARRRSLIGKDG